MFRKLLHTLLLSASLIAAALPAAAQQDAHSLSVGANYTWIHTNLLPGCNCFSMNGGGGEVQWGLNRHWAIVGDITVAHRGDITSNSYDLTQLTYTGGVRYTPLARHFGLHPFGEVLAGGAHASGSLRPSNTVAGGDNAFAFQTGGGVDFPLGTHWILVPARVDYLLTTFNNGADDRQNDIRFSAGVRFVLRRTF